jgi:hypothetical protein
MPGSSTTPGRSDLAMVRPKRVAFRTRNGVGTRGLAFAAQWLAYALPYRRFVAVLADANARLGADVDRYSFIVVDLHHLLLAGLPAHFESSHPSHAVWPLWDMSRLQNCVRRIEEGTLQGSPLFFSTPPDAMGRTTGTARTNSNGVTGAQTDASGAREHAWLAAAPFFLHLLTHTEDAVFVLDDVHGNPHLIPPLDTSAAGSNAC